ncbi:MULTISPECIES: hypothetical protein [Nocardiopsis]|uniref:Uncharacterized protein n=1 Tax=Nocardiopsis sinuspersici TaxID=501010 RepID=A0A7Y9XA44_9ACTN|nr:MULTISPECIES: hypothetical protein [Nocardiopsis]NYH51863.1 hypothetical protein [Nocardiopsis sinuspersici]
MTTPETAPPAEGRTSRGILSPVLTAATLVVLLPLGAAAGLFSTTGAGWLLLYWDAGPWPRTLAVAGLLAFLALLYCACRLCAWGGRRPSASVAFAAGFLASVIALVGYMPGGDLVLTNHITHNAYLFGAMLVLMLAIIRSDVFAFLTGPRATAPAVPRGYQSMRSSE